MVSKAELVAIRLRLTAFQVLARRRIGVAVEPEQAGEWLARFPILGDALQAFARESASQKRVPQPAIHSFPDQLPEAYSVSDRPAGALSKPVSHTGLARSESTVPISRSRGPIGLSVLAVVGFWSSLVVVAAVQKAFGNAGNFPEMAKFVAISGAAVTAMLVSGVRLWAARTDILRRHWLTPLVVSALAVLIGFVAMPLVERLGYEVSIGAMVLQLPLIIWFVTASLTLVIPWRQFNGN